MERPNSSATSPSIGCMAGTDASLPTKKEKSENNCMMSKENMQTENGLLNPEDHTNPSHKRKFSEDTNVHTSAESSHKIGKYEMPNGLTQQLPCQSEVTHSTTIEPANKSPKTRNKSKRSLWIMSCDRCSFETNIMNEFTYHIDNIHPNLNDFKCHKCPIATTSSSLLNMHDRYNVPYFIGKYFIWRGGPKYNKRGSVNRIPNHTQYVLFNQSHQISSR